METGTWHHHISKFLQKRLYGICIEDPFVTGSSLDIIRFLHENQEIGYAHVQRLCYASANSHFISPFPERHQLLVSTHVVLSCPFCLLRSFNFTVYHEQTSQVSSLVVVFRVHKLFLVPVPSICLPHYSEQASDDCMHLGVKNVINTFQA